MARLSRQSRQSTGRVSNSPAETSQLPQQPSRPHQPTSRSAGFVQLSLDQMFEKDSLSRDVTSMGIVGGSLNRVVHDSDWSDNSPHEPNLKHTSELSEDRSSSMTSLDEPPGKKLNKNASVVSQVVRQSPRGHNRQSFVQTSTTATIVDGHASLNKPVRPSLSPPRPAYFKQPTSELPSSSEPSSNLVCNTNEHQTFSLNTDCSINLDCKLSVSPAAASLPRVVRSSRSTRNASSKLHSESSVTMPKNTHARSGRKAQNSVKRNTPPDASSAKAKDPSRSQTRVFTKAPAQPAPAQTSPVSVQSRDDTDVKNIENRHPRSEDNVHKIDALSHQLQTRNSNQITPFDGSDDPVWILPDGVTPSKVFTDWAAGFRKSLDSQDTREAESGSPEPLSPAHDSNVSPSQEPEQNDMGMDITRSTLTLRKRRHDAVIEETEDEGSDTDDASSDNDSVHRRLNAGHCRFLDPPATTSDASDSEDDSCRDDKDEAVDDSDAASAENDSDNPDVSVEPPAKRAKRLASTASPAFSALSTASAAPASPAHSTSPASRPPSASPVSPVPPAPRQTRRTRNGDMVRKAAIVQAKLPVRKPPTRAKKAVATAGLGTGGNPKPPSFQPTITSKKNDVAQRDSRQADKKKYLSQGMYIGQDKAGLAWASDNKILSPPMFFGADRLHKTTDFKLPYGIFSPSGPGQPKPEGYKKISQSK